MRMEGFGILDNSKKRLKIAFLAPINSDNTLIGGADIHIKSLIEKYQLLDDIDIHIITMNKEINCSIKEFNKNITSHIIKSPNLPKTITGFTIDYRKIIKVVKEIKPDMVHAQVLGAPYGLAAMKLCKQYPTILTVHTLVELDAKNRSGTVKEKIHDGIWRNLEIKEIKRIPNFIAVSKNIEHELKKRGAQNVKVIPNGISDSWFNVSNVEIEGRILFVGRVVPIKAIEHLIQMLKIVQKRVPKAHLHIVGPVSDKEYKKKLNVIVDKMDIQNSVIFKGPKNGADLEKEYSECSVFALTSKEESFGIVLLEAMASGKPIVATEVGGIPEIIKNEEEGILVKYGDVEQLAENIMKLLSDSELRKRMGSTGKNTAKQYDWHTIAEKTVNYYKEILGESR